MTASSLFRLPLCFLSLLPRAALSQTRVVMSGGGYRKDGVRIVHDPNAPGMAEKYGKDGATDQEGFDPYADTVGPGIYGGAVKRDASGNIVVGSQYQNHNPRPGPVYDGSGYSAMARALHSGKDAVIALLDERPELVHEVSTGGATPLHLCGMSQGAQRFTELIISRGGDVEAEDTYGYRPLHRMASNNLAIGAMALLAANAVSNASTEPGGRGTPEQIARSSHANEVLRVLKQYSHPSLPR
mmetsp:Transcript_35001/g.87287  ORF Transcript_35001/g.87287 Transcript_35001/m.87287 type:complete len:242 (-) Transcript_35001:229-954(-)